MKILGLQIWLNMVSVESPSNRDPLFITRQLAKSYGLRDMRR